MLNFVKLGGLQLSNAAISWVGIFLGRNFSGEIYPGWEFSGWELSWVGIVRVGIILGGYFPRWQFSGWEFSCCQECKSTKKSQPWPQRVFSLLWGRDCGRDWPKLNEKESTENQTRLMSWRRDLITYNSHPTIMFHFNWEEVRLKLAVQGQRGRRMLDVDGGQEGRGVGGGVGLGKSTIFMDVICVSFLMVN